MFEKYLVNPKDVVDCNTRLVIDLDSMAFKLASGAEKTEVEIINKATNKSHGIFKNRTEFFGGSKKNIQPTCVLGELNAERASQGLSEHSSEDFEAKDIQTPIVGYSTMLGHLDEWVDGVAKGVGIPRERVIFLMGDSGSFRDDIKLPKKYKDDRKSTLKPLMLRELRSRTIEKTNAIMHDNFEADDVLNMYQFKGYQDYLKTGKASYIVSTIDKDAYGTSGFITNYDKLDGVFKDNSLYLLPNPQKDIGELKLKRSVVKGCGLKWFICQSMLLGDSGDGYYAYQYFPHLKGAYGPTKCYNDLLEIETAQELLVYARDKWKEWFPDGVVEYTDWCGDEHSIPWQDFVELIFQCAYMKRSYNDTMTLRKLYERFGVDIDG